MFSSDETLFYAKSARENFIRLLIGRPSDKNFWKNNYKASINLS